ncbi:HPr family phosphocarrier protein [Shewanella sp. VB17]|uniref:HPr family phosphocarrier protein n=1 Tax=Shewanella sp. VB17 TaxID=2739432 RepID=UPI0015668C7D|nr:HPr family phosphocarrier protein [Shewanella sp. VB17]NRD74157.1 HPr family phosphocarrier protein [Shewanella sp. VB17]
MHEKIITIMAKHGIHTRPAAMLVKAAKNYECDVIVECNGKQASAKSLFKLQNLGLYHGVTIKIFAVGPEAEHAVEKISELIITLN